MQQCDVQYSIPRMRGLSINTWIPLQLDLTTTILFVTHTILYDVHEDNMTENRRL